MAVLAASCGILGLAAIAAPQPSMAQSLQGQCRQVNQDTFIYRTRSQTDPLSALAQNERVTLAEETGRDGWIAVTSPSTGFVRTQLLAICVAAPLSMPPEPPIPPPPARNTVVTPSQFPTLPPPTRAATPVRQSPYLCRRVNYPEPEGMAVRSGPGLSFARVGGIFYNDIVTIEPSATQLDGEGRQWLRLLSPVSGWSANGFPTLNEGNFASCP
ncbi:SH3 domain-containing protein [Oscillatoria sp. FACHB-1406]|nr:SH3 domain-containing protein [Oscillatoria sp. FACHB-1406]